jgi:hypothetical protein
MEPEFDFHTIFNINVIFSGSTICEKSIENIDISLPSLWYSDEIYMSKKRLQEVYQPVPQLQTLNSDNAIVFEKERINPIEEEQTLLLPSSSYTTPPSFVRPTASLIPEALAKKIEIMMAANEVQMLKDRVLSSTLFKNSEINFQTAYLDGGKGE